MLIQENFSLKSLNTFGLDVKCRFYARIESVIDLQSVLADTRFASVRKMVLGGGSNVLFTRDYDGLIIHNFITGIKKVKEDDQFAWIEAGGGVVWHEFVLHTVNLGLGGLENLSLIPGFVGAAPIQNIGAYGVEIKDTFDSLRAFNMESGKEETFDLATCQFGYRDSIFKQEAKGKYLITSVTFRLTKNPKINTSYGAIEEQLKSVGITSPTIKDVSNAVIAIRQSKLPDPKVIGNAGSFFKNPEVPAELFAKLQADYPTIVGYKTKNDLVKLAAGWLIEQAGWKGKQIGNTGMHSKQALVLVNHGHATGSELIDHAKRVQQSVQEKFGVWLEMEVNLIN